MFHRRIRVASAALLAISAIDSSCAKAPPPPPKPLGPAPATCNGHAELCSRPYDAVAYAGTHGSYSDSDESFGAPDQTHPIAQQLADGIRVLHMEIHFDQGRPFVCHGLCIIGEKPLRDDLSAVKTFIDQNPDNVVTLLLERSDDMITADEIATDFIATGLSPSVHSQAPGAPWPTLNDLIRHREQVVAFLDDTTGSHFGWLMPRWSYTWETPWDNRVPSDFGRCNADRGKQGNDLYVVDTYLEDQIIPSADHAALVNYDPFLIDRVLYCRQATGVMPNFVMVNFYEVSDVFHVVDVLNGFAPAPGDDLSQFPPSQWPSSSTTSSSTGAGG